MLDLNLLPEDMKERSGPDPWHVWSVIAVIVILGAVSILSNGMVGELRGLQNQADQLRVEADHYRPFIEQQNALNVALQELDGEISIAKQVSSMYMPWSDYLARFLNAIPTTQGRLEVRLDKVSMRKAGRQDNKGTDKPVAVLFSFSGSALNEEAAYAFVRRFEEDPDFTIKLSSTRIDQKSGYFLFTASVGIVEIREVTSAQ